MIEQALRYMKEVGETANHLESVYVEKLRKVFVRHGDKVESFDPLPDLRNHQVYDLGDLCDLAQFAEKPEIWYSGTQCVLLMDAARRERATLKFEFCPGFQWAKTWAADHSVMSTKDLIRLMQTELAGLIVEDTVIDALRQVKWTEKSETVQHNMRDQDTMGRATDRKVSGVDKVPDSFTIRTPVLARPQLEIEEGQPTVEVLMVANFDHQGFQLFTVKRTLWLAEQCVLDVLRDQIGFHCKHPIFHGTP